MIASVDELIASAENDAEPPSGISDELRSLWHAKRGEWDAAHDIAQEIHTTMGSWIHAHLHLVEGDRGNAGYWYGRAGKPPRGPEEIDDEWRELTQANLG